MRSTAAAPTVPRSAPAAVSFLAETNRVAAAIMPTHIQALASTTPPRLNPPSRRVIPGPRHPGRPGPALHAHAARPVQIDPVAAVPSLHGDQPGPRADAPVRGEGRLVEAAGDRRQGDRRSGVRAGEGHPR